MFFVTCFTPAWIESVRRFKGVGVSRPDSAEGNTPATPTTPTTATTQKTGSWRCFGYFSLLKDALEAVGRNAMDMHERRYTLLVIEEIHEGIGRISENEMTLWFKWMPQACPDGHGGQCNTSGRGSWIACERPEETMDMVNFSIG